MANKTQVIRIESILGGHAPSAYFSASDQFLDSVGIDPSESYTATADDLGDVPSGIITPTAVREISPNTMAGAPMWLGGSPRTTLLFAYAYNGSIYTVSSGTNISGLGDLNDGGTARGNGMAYYDNYIYFARDTTVARYGPLDGTPAFTDDYWVGTLGKPALTNTQYPDHLTGQFDYPNHILCRHSDGKLYILDVQDNKGTLHYIQTTKTTVEGDTDNGSTFNKIEFGYGLYPTAVESYGSGLVIALLESESGAGSSNQGDSQTNAKIAFWDTVSQKATQIIWAEYPDQFISSIKNVNGVLYFLSGQNPATHESGFRLMKYIGGSSFEEIKIFPNLIIPPAGCVDKYSDRLYFASRKQNTGVVSAFANLFAYGRGFNGIGSGLFSVRGYSASTNTTVPTSLTMDYTDELHRVRHPFSGWTNTSTGLNGIDIGSGFGNIKNEWFSQIYKIGQPFKITKVRIPLAQNLTSSMDVDVEFFLDGIVGSPPQWKDLVNINSANYGTNTQMITIKPENLVGEHSFCLHFEWTGTEQCAIALPITIEYELLDVDTARP